MHLLVIFRQFIVLMLIMKLVLVLLYVNEYFYSFKGISLIYSLTFDLSFYISKYQKGIIYLYLQRI